MSTLLRKICSSFLKRSYCYLSRGARVSSDASRAGDDVTHTTKTGVRYVVRSLTRKDVPQLVEIGKELRSIDCVSCLYSWIESDPHGIKVAVTAADEILGSCCAVMNGDSDEDGLCFGGVYFVRKEFQSQGIGQKLWAECYKHIGGRNAGLNSVPGKLQIYRESGGFPVYDPTVTSLEYHTASWPLDFASFASVPPPGIDIRPFDPTRHLPAIFAYDEKVVGFRRTGNMRLNLLEDGSRTLVAFRGGDGGGKGGGDGGRKGGDGGGKGGGDRDRKGGVDGGGNGGGDVVGFGTVKVTCLGAVRVGPLYADDPIVAEVLLRRLVEMHRDAGGFVFVTTSGNAAAVEWMERLGFEAFEECERLYTKRPLKVDLSKVFAQFDVNFAPF